MVNILKKRGFSLTEVLVATIVMSMIMTGVLGFVTYGGQIWQRGQEKINAQNYNDMAFQLLKDDLLQADSIIVPADIDEEKALAPSSSIQYIASNTRYEIKIDSTNSTLTKITYPSTTPATTLAATPVTSSQIKIARNVKNFYVYRLSTWTVEIALQIQSPIKEDEDGESIEPEIVSSDSMVLLAPGVE